MKFGQYITEAWKSLLSSKMRSGLTMLGIVIGVASVIAMLAIGQGAQNSINGAIQSIGSNLLFVTSGAQGVTVIQPLTLEDSQALNDPLNAPDVAEEAPVLQATATVTYTGTTITTALVGTTSTYQDLESLTLTNGDFFSDIQEAQHSLVAVLGSKAATNLLGTTEGIVGDTIRIQGIPFKIIGVLASKGGNSFGSSDDNIFVPLSTIQTRLSARAQANAVDEIIVQATSTNTVQNAIDEVTQILMTRHNVAKADFSIINEQEILGIASSITGVLTIFLGGIGGISLLVGGIGIMNIMFVVVSERTKEIGLRKALGARKIDIMIQFLMESAFLSLTGGLIGVGLAWVITRVIARIALNSGTNFTPIISLNIILLATLFSTAIGLFFGFYPSSRAASLEPVEALRIE